MKSIATILRGSGESKFVLYRAKRFRPEFSLIRRAIFFAVHLRGIRSAYGVQHQRLIPAQICIGRPTKRLYLTKINAYGSKTGCPTISDLIEQQKQMFACKQGWELSLIPARFGVICQLTGV